jgi:hypothetical protein
VARRRIATRDEGAWPPVTFFVVPDQGAVVARLGMTDATVEGMIRGGGIGSGGHQGTADRPSILLTVKPRPRLACRAGPKALVGS